MKPEFDQGAYDKACQDMRGLHIVLELVRDKNGRVINVHGGIAGDVFPVSKEHEPGYVQVLEGQVVQHFEPHEIVVVPVRGVANRRIK